MKFFLLFLLIIPIVYASNETFVNLKEELSQPYKTQDHSFYSLTFLVGVIFIFLVFYYAPKHKNHKKPMFKMK